MTMTPLPPGTITERAKMHMLMSSVQTRLWFGLLTKVPPDFDGEADNALSRLAQFEPPTELGYARIPLRGDDWEEDPDTPFYIRSREVTWKNVGTAMWPMVSHSFLATTEDNTGFVFYYTNTSRPITLMMNEAARLFAQLGLA